VGTIIMIMKIIGIGDQNYRMYLLYESLGWTYLLAEHLLLRSSFVQARALARDLAQRAIGTGSCRP
jgi:hypothetical protein